MDESTKAVISSRKLWLKAAVSRSPPPWLPPLAYLGRDGSIPDPTSYWPRVGGIRFYIATLRPGLNASTDDGGTDLAALMAQYPDLGEKAAYADSSGFHTDDCVTLHLVQSGKVTLELDDGVQTVLSPGDVLVQNGIRHRWIGDDDEPATVAMVMIGAEVS